MLDRVMFEGRNQSQHGARLDIPWRPLRPREALSDLTVERDRTRFSTEKPRRLNRREVRLVCSLINDGDREFLDILLAHVRVDSNVSRAVVKAICRTPERLTPTGAENLLRLLNNQGQPKYARNLALEILRTISFASSFEVVQQCAEILAENIGSLTARQRDKLIGRAISYPASWSLRPWPVQHVLENSKAEDITGAIDYAGAVSVLLLPKLPHYRFGRRRLLAQAVQFARHYPEATNFWLELLSIHAPGELHTWQTHLSGTAPRRHLVGGIVRATAATTVPWASLQLLGWIVGAPKPPWALVVSVATLSPLWGLQIAMSVRRDLRRLAEKYEVSPAQAKQVLDTRC